MPINLPKTKFIKIAFVMLLRQRDFFNGRGFTIDYRQNNAKITRQLRVP